MKKTLLFVALLLASVPAFAQTARQDMEKFVSFYDAQRRAEGFRPDEHTSRDQRVAFLQQTVKRFCHPHLAMKRASPTRPISDEAVVWVRPSTPGRINPEYRLFWDFIRSGGSSAWQLTVDGGGEHLPVDQPLVNPLTLGELAEPIAGGKVPTVPGCTGPTPAPTPTPQPPAAKPYPGDAYFVEKVGIVLVADYAEAGQMLNAGSVVWISRTLWRYLNEGMSIEQSTSQSRKEWRGALGLPALP
jgi:hypothetical protein